ncbi:hypothetical protein FRC03_001332 [Tulasnella sp. 419]|nr:hypothetical protein FRC03_001332 [Tulasnella sp. 419]
MSSPHPPPILEIEDQHSRLNANRESLLNDPPDIQSPLPTNKEHSEPTLQAMEVLPTLPTNEEQNKPILQAIDVPPPNIDDHVAYWSVYNKEAEEFDAEMLRAWNDSLDVLLIFAGLFSAVNTAFIIESYKGLNPDPAEITNTLLRLLITHRNDNITLTAEDLHPTELNPSALSTNYIFFASLYSSLSAAFGAVTAKQWLTEYSHKGPAKAPHVLGLHRSMKFRGLERWHFQFVIDLLPILLQLSLVLFLIGVVDFLWVLNRKVGMMQLVLVLVGIGVYLTTLTIGVISPTSPFRTPLTKYIRDIIWFSIRKIVDIAERVGAIAERVGGAIKEGLWKSAIDILVEIFEDRQYFLIPVWLIMMPLSLLLDCFRHIRRALWYLLRESWSLFPTSKEGERDPNEQKAKPQWNLKERTAAHSVVWLLEHSEHPDTTVVALDAARRLNPNLVLAMIQKREGLVYRLRKFCYDLLPPESTDPLQWVARLSDKAVISMAALHHVDPFGLGRGQKTARTLYDDPIVINSLPGISSLAIRLLAIHNSRIGSFWLDLKLEGSIRTRWLMLLLKSLDFSTKSDQFHTDLYHGIQASISIPLSTRISLPQLALDALIKASEEYDYTRNWLGYGFQVSWTETPHILQAILQADTSYRTIKHVALVIATIRLMICNMVNSSFWSYPSEMDKSKLKRRVAELHKCLYKSTTVHTYIELVLSLVDGPGDEIFCTSSANIYYTLLTLTKELLRKQPSKDFTFYAGLLRLSRVYSSDPPTQVLIIELLSFCKDWAIEGIEQYKDDMSRFLKYRFTSSSGYQSFEDPDSPLHKLLYWLAYTSSDDLFLHIFPTVYSGLTTDDTTGTPISLSNAPQFIRNRILRSDSSKSPDPKVAYSYQIALALVIPVHQQNSRDLWSMVYFVSKMQDTELHWPVYFPSSRIKWVVEYVDGMLLHSSSISDLQEEWLSQEVSRIISETNMDNLWRGECTMLLWKGASNAFREDRLPEDWSDAVFFQSSVVDMMKKYYYHIKQQQQQYVERDQDTLRAYFRKALERGWQPHRDSPSSVPKSNPEEEQPITSMENVADASKVEVTFEGKEAGIAQTPSAKETAREEARTSEERHVEIKHILDDLGG